MPLSEHYVTVRIFTCEADGARPKAEDTPS